jgi:hypothetical protein
MQERSKVKKKKWEKPKLLILTRGRPEESVLGVCKGTGLDNVAPSLSNASCRRWLVFCYVCDSQASS